MYTDIGPLNREGGWTHVTLSFQKDERKAFHSENAKGKGLLNRGANYFTDGSTGYAIFIGRKYIDGDGVDVDVIIDELTFWNRALSEREVNALYCQHNPKGCSK